MKQLYIRKQLKLLGTLLLISGAAFAQIPSYYNGTNLNQTGNTLKTTLSQLISANTTSLSYTPGVWDALKLTDIDPANPNNVLLVYGYNDTDTDTSNDRTRSKDANGGNAGQWNREHVYAKSLGVPNLGTSGPGSDAHHLRASDIAFNATRSNYPYGAGSGNAGLFNNTFFYPGDEWKGDVARMLMYMYLRYGEQCLPANVTVGPRTFNNDITDILLLWNIEDPVSQFELNRNTILEGVQGNRNPFIDNPAFATTIWGGPQAENRFTGNTTADTQAPTTPSNLVVNSVTQDTALLNWTLSTDDVAVLGYRIFNGTNFLASSQNNSYNLAGLTANTSYTLTIKAFDAAGNNSLASNTVTFTTTATTTAPNPIATVFINEIHYDNAGTDVGEGVEIAGTAGTDLSNWSIIPYNGNGGASYTPVGVLSGTIPEQSNGFGTVFVPIIGLQNGGPDGLALINNLGEVVQFLSYEGSFVATNGPANGMTSTDIGVIQNGLDAAGLSLQLVGTGNSYANFTWQAATTSTYGAVNLGQSFTKVALKLVPPTNVVASNLTTTAVTLSWEPSNGTAYTIYNNDEELQTVTTNSATLSNLKENTTYNFTVRAIDEADNSSDPSAAITVTTLKGTATTTTATVFINEIHYDNAGTDLDEGVEIAGPAGTDITNWKIIPYNGSGGASYTPIGVLSGVIPDQANGYGTVSIAIASLQNGAPDGIVLVDNNDNVIQFLSYEGSFTATNGPANGLTSTDIGVAETSTATIGTSLQLVGKGTTYTDFTWEAATSTFGAVNAGQNFGDLVFINEIHYDNAGTDENEGVEIAGYAGTDLTNWNIVPYNGSNGASYTPIGTLSGSIPNQSKGYGTVYVAIPGLQNGSPDALALVNPEGKVVQFLSYEGSFTATNGPANGITSTDIGIAEASTAAIGSSLQLTGAGFKYSDFTWQAATATSGAINSGQFFKDVADTLIVLPIAEARAKADGEIVTITGTLTVSDQLGGSAYIQDATGAVAVFDKTVHGTGLFKIGESLTITGNKSTYNEQIQISPVSAVKSNGQAAQLISPLTITLSEMSAHPGELVRIQNPVFAKPGAIIFGNSSVDITDATAKAQFRLDADVADLTGFSQPENCSEVIGVVSNFYATQQLLPRMQSDFPCAAKYQQAGTDLAISKDKTLDIVTWNIAWFGDEKNAPTAGQVNADEIQKEAVKTVLQSLDADIYAVEEISDEPLFKQMVSEMNDYSYVLSKATSYPNDTTTDSQKVGFIYKNKTVKPVSTKVLLETVHPYYNGGDVSALANYPTADKTRFFASGRMPFMLTANVTIDGTEKQINIIDLHARANTSGGAQEKYDMRKFDVEMLKDSLDTQYPDANLILLGDYNDDVDFTVSDVTTTASSYSAYVADTTRYSIPTKSLSDGGFRSYATYENMIDHITLSNELATSYIPETARVHYEFYSATYTKTASDHFPVSIRLKLKDLKIESVSSSNTICFGNEDGFANVTVSGGISPYTFTWNTGATTSEITNLAAGKYTVVIEDAVKQTVTSTFTIEESKEIQIPSADEVTVYKGYSPQAYATLKTGTITGGVLPFTYEWSNGAKTASIKVCPDQTTTYTLTVTDAAGCTATTERTVNVQDVSCGNNRRYPKVEICHKGKTICVDEYAVRAHLAHGDTLGGCDNSTPDNSCVITNVVVYPNPFVSNVNVSINSTAVAKADFYIYNIYGQLVSQSSQEIAAGKSVTNLELSKLRRGFYFLKTVINGKNRNVKYLIKK